MDSWLSFIIDEVYKAFVELGLEDHGGNVTQRASGLFEFFERIEGKVTKDFRIEIVLENIANFFEKISLVNSQYSIVIYCKSVHFFSF